MVSTDPNHIDRPLTYRDLDDLPDDGNRYEIIDGVLYVTPFPSTAHQQAATRLTAILSNHVAHHDLGRVFAAGMKVVLDEPSGVGPDLVYISLSRMDGLKADGYYGAPDLVVEVLSSRPALDLHVKKQRYARAGIPHYWIVDSDQRRLLIFVLEGERYRMDGELQGDATFEPAVFPGLSVPLAELWL
jgi:Uma2 family endonuclease